jgi:UDP-N-acetylmuramoyl-tripeptide--D-alanyl-D-alanine ligase
VVVRAGGLTIVDDAYNASTGSMRAALDLLSGLPGRHVAVLGEMRELGTEHDAGHHAVGQVAATTLDLLVIVDGAPGGAARGILEGAVAAGMSEAQILVVPTAATVVERLLPLLAPGDVVLVKASRGVELESVVDELVVALGGREAGA